jgi:hypothetical protein
MRHGVGDCYRDGNDSDFNILRLDEGFQCAEFLHQVAVKCVADQCGVGVEHGNDPESSLSKARIGHERPSNTSGADDGDVPAAIHGQGPSKSFNERRQSVANTRSAALPKVAQVASHLSVGHGQRQ